MLLRVLIHIKINIRERYVTIKTTDIDYNDANKLLLENEHHLGEIMLST